MSDLITLTIDGREVQVPKGTLLVEAAREIGIEIPVFCYHPKLKPVGACRMCLVEIEKMPRLQAACTSPVAEGWVVSTKSEPVIAAQKGVIELLLANHPLDCPVCDKGGECPLQDNTFAFGLGESRFTEDKRNVEKAYPLSDRILLDRERCIMCYRCVRFHQEIPGDESLAAIQRGGRTVIGTLEGESYDSPFSGNTIDICPVGALTSRQYRFRARPWDLDRSSSICSGCAVGCNIEVHSRRGDVLRLVPRENPEVNDGWLCDHGRFDTMPPLPEHRQLEPMIRTRSGLEVASWDQALARAASVIRERGFSLTLGSRVSNEALWILKSMHAALGGHAAPNANAWPMTGSYTALMGCRVIVLVGLDPWRELPVLALWIRRAVLAGARLVVIGPENGLARDTSHWIRVEAGAEGAAVHDLLADATQVASEQAVPDGSLAAVLNGRPAAVLVGQRLEADPVALAEIAALAERLGAIYGDAPVGVLMPGANDRGLHDLAAGISMPVLGEAVASIAFGDSEAGGSAIAAHWHSADVRDARADVVLPLMHPYEQDGSFTNVEGRVQTFTVAAAAPGVARPDWEAAALLALRLGVDVPVTLAGLRVEMAAHAPAYSAAFAPGEEALARA